MSGDYDVIIIGFGIAGTALSHVLGSKGKRVLVIERDLTEPHKIIGELLQPLGVELLHKMGMEECLEGIDAPSILGYAVFLGQDQKAVPLPYPKREDASRPRGRSFHHGRFIQNLRRKAAEQRNVTVYEGVVTKLLISSPAPEGRVTGVEWRSKDGSTHTEKATMTFVCDGLFSNFRKHFTTDTVQHKSQFVGVILKDLELPFPNHGHVMLMEPTPSLCYPISSRESRVLVDVPEPLPKKRTDLKKYLQEVTAPQMPNGIREAFLRALEEDNTLKSMPSGKLHTSCVYRRGAMRVGDAFNVRSALTGGGMSVAFSDVYLIGETIGSIRSLDDDAAVESALREFFSRRQKMAATINVLAQALYEVFSHPTLRKATVDYFLLGGEAVNGPMSLLSGLNQSPATLISHFFAVAFYGAFNLLVPPWPSNVATGLEALKKAVQIIFPLVRGEHLLDVSYPSLDPKVPVQEVKAKL